jgi:hypothetical protein
MKFSKRMNLERAEVLAKDAARVGILCTREAAMPSWESQLLSA